MAPSFTTTNAQRLEGKVALITGGVSGLGRATAQEFIQNGAQIVIADINSEVGQSFAEELGPSAHFVKCDVSVEAQVKEAVDVTMARHGKLDIMFNNAGIVGSFPPSIVDLDLEEFDKVIQVNVRGVLAGVKHAARVMIPVGSGSILCTSSIAGLMGGLGPRPYSISKSAVCGIVKTMAIELCKYGIRINCISPGPIVTPLLIKEMSRFYPTATEERIVEIINGLGEIKGVKSGAIDIAKAALYLASDEAKFVSGQNLVVDGGITSFRTLNFPAAEI